MGSGPSGSVQPLTVPAKFIPWENLDVVRSMLGARRAAGWVWAISAIVAVGCKGVDAPDVVPVSGLATRNGQPVPSVTLCFQPSSGRPSFGECDSPGKL